MRVLAGTTEDIIWLCRRADVVPANLTVNTRSIKVVDRDGRIRGMVAYGAWTPNAVQCHMAVDTPIAWRSLLGPAFKYPFVEQGRGVMIGTVPADNERSIKMVESLGFQLHHVVVKGFTTSVDMLIYEMRREDCRWLGV